MTLQSEFHILRRGDTGPAVQDLARRLLDIDGGLPGGADKKCFDTQIEDIVLQFQLKRGLTPDGVVGPITWGTLVEAGWQLGDRVLYERRPWLRGDDVAELQEQLAGLGFDIGKIDGLFGPLARRATEEFQRSTGLRPDGIAGATTLHALRQVRGAPAGKPSLAVRERLRVRTAGSGLAGKRIFIDPRGGASDPGPSVDSGLVEADFTHALALALAGKLRAENAHPLLSRGPAEDPTPSDRAATANWFAADFVVGLGTNTGGTTIAVHHFGTHRWASPMGERLATCLGQAAAVTLGLSMTPTKPSTDAILRETRAIAVIVETPANWTLPLSDLADAMCYGIAQFLADAGCADDTL